MPAPKTRLDHTPHYDKWLERLNLHLAPRGRKTELARFMAAERGQPVHTWQVRVNKIASLHQMINAEDVLSITAWMDGLPDA